MNDADRPPAPFEPDLPHRFGDYQLLAEIGRGGMGVIYQARQEGLDRLCAVKMLRPDDRADQPSAENSLRAEATAAASLDHPNIVGIYEVGREQGQLFFSMEFVDGEDLGRYVRSRFLDAATIARLMAKIADAIAYAHGRKVLHHDLKPANVVIDPDGEPQITDFGLARRVDEARRSDPSRGAGSPNYLSPEQASARFGEPGIPTDVFGLGAILYFLLTDRPPFLGFTAEDTIRAVLETDPVRPGVVRPGVSAELETICLKCLEKQPDRRYASARDVADECRRFLADEPIRARPASLMERFRKWCRRHPAIAALASLVAILLLLITAGSSAAAMRIHQARQRAEASELDARRNLYNADMLLASAALAADNDGQVREIVRRQVPRPGEPDLRGWEWHFLEQGTRGDVEAVIGRHDQAIVQLAATPDGRFVVAADNGGAVKVWDFVSHRELASRQVSEAGAPLFCLATTTNWVLSTLRSAGGSNSSPVLLTLPDLDIVHQFSVPGRQYARAFDPGDASFWTVGQSDLTQLDSQTGAVLRRHPIPRVGGFRELAFSTVARRFAEADQDGQLRLWNLDDGSSAGRLTGHAAQVYWAQPVFGLEFSPDGRWLLSAGSDGSVRLWDPVGLRLVREIGGHSRLVMSVAFSADSRRAISAGKDSFLQSFSVDGGIPIRLRGADAVQIAACFTPGDARILSGGIDGAIRLWRAEPRRHLRWQTNLPPRTGETAGLEDDEHFAAYGAEGRVEVRRLDDGRLLPLPRFPTNTVVSAVERLHDGRLLTAALTEDGRLIVQREPGASTTEVRVASSPATHFRRTASLALSPDLRFVGIADLIDGIHILAADSGATVARLPERVRAMAFAPHGNWLVAAELGGPIHLWSLPEGRPGPSGMSHPQASNVAFSPDGSHFATVGWDGAVRLWDVASGRSLATLTSSAGNLFAVAWAPDLHRLFAGSLDGAVCVWDLNTGRETFVRREHSQPVVDLSVRPNGDLLSFGPDGVLTWPVNAPPDKP